MREEERKAHGERKIEIGEKIRQTENQRDRRREKQTEERKMDR